MLSDSDKDALLRMHARHVFTNGEIGAAFGCSAETVRQVVAARDAEEAAAEAASWRRTNPVDAPIELRTESLTDEEVTAMRAAYAAGGVSFGDLALQYRVTKPMAQNAVRGKTFTHLPGALRGTPRKVEAP